MTSGFRCAAWAAVRRFKNTKPNATRERRTTAILRYVFRTSAEPYSSTNWRFAFSSVFGFRSATVAVIGTPSPRQHVQANQIPCDPDSTRNDPQQGCNTEEDEEESGKRRRRDLLPWRIVKETLRHWLAPFHRDTRRAGLTLVGRTLSPPRPEKIELV